MNGKRLTQEFYRRDTIEVARHLLGQILVHRLPDGSRLSGKIVETEAYLGAEDPAAHSFNNRRTPRTEPMFGRPGLSYIYFIYGVHFCFNVVTAEENIPEAVLIRALEPIEGLDQLANGPGKLCAAMKLGREQNALDLCTNETLWIEKNDIVLEDQIVEGPRVGIGRELDHIHWPLRFGIKNHPALSKPKFPVPFGDEHTI